MPMNKAFHIIWLAAVGAFLLCTACTLAPASAEPESVQEQQFQDSLIHVMDAVKQDWNSGRYDNLKSYWDQNDENPIYLAEEADLIMTSWPEIEAYWQATDAWVEWIVIDYRNYRVKRVDENNAIVAFDLRFDLKLNDRANPIGGDNRGVVNFRKVDGDWKIHTWVEAPLSAITYMRKLYELNVSDDLPAR